MTTFSANTSTVLQGGDNEHFGHAGEVPTDFEPGT